MKFSLKRLPYIVTALTLFATSLIVSLPARASLPCRGGTISSYSNGSIASCVLDTDVDITAGNFTFACHQGHSISFDDKAHFESCILNTALSVRKGSEIKICPEKSMVQFSTLKDGSQFLSCQGL